MKYPLNGLCQDCRHETWSVCLMTQFGPLHLCANDASWFMSVRRKAAMKDKVDRFLSRVFKRGGNAVSHHAGVGQVA